ncbi:MAG TPA: hypothetical protein VF815_28715 [Myxococcaceae bacterium]|jgi:hypothetical protein
METTLSFSDAMTRLSETLYSSAKVHVNTRRSGRLTETTLKADAWEYITFDLKVDDKGEVNTQVAKYCAGYLLRCTAWIEFDGPATRISGSLFSSDGGGLRFENLGSGQPIRFEMTTSMWHSTKFSLKLKATPGLPAGAALKVRFRIGY